MQGPAVVGRLRSLHVTEKRFADVAERDFFEIGERRNGRILAAPLTCPNTQERSERCNAGMKIGHAASLWIARLGYETAYGRDAGFARSGPSVSLRSRRCAHRHRQC